MFDILGVDSRIDLEQFSFKSVGEGSQQLNRSNVYSELYEYGRHVILYIVVVRIGNQYERSKPGNQSKRDSQIILVKSLSKAHFHLEMTPLKLDLPSDKKILSV